MSGVDLLSAWEALGRPDYHLPLLPRHVTLERQKAERAKAKTKGRKAKHVPGSRLIMLKSSPLAVRVGPSASITKRPEWRAFAGYAVPMLVEQVQRARPIIQPGQPLLVSCVYAPPDRVSPPDIDGVVGTMLDLLQAPIVPAPGSRQKPKAGAGAYPNDAQVARTDYSEIWPPAPSSPGVWVWVRRIKPNANGGWYVLPREASYQNPRHAW